MLSTSCAFKACLFVRLLTCFIAFDVELEIIDAQKYVSLVFFFVLFSFFLLLGRFFVIRYFSRSSRLF